MNPTSDQSKNQEQPPAQVLVTVTETMMMTVTAPAPVQGNVEVQTVCHVTNDSCHWDLNANAIAGHSNSRGTLRRQRRHRHRLRDHLPHGTRPGRLIKLHALWRHVMARCPSQCRRSRQLPRLDDCDPGLRARLVVHPRRAGSRHWRRKSCWTTRRSTCRGRAHSGSNVRCAILFLILLSG